MLVLKALSTLEGQTGEKDQLALQTCPRLFGPGNQMS